MRMMHRISEAELPLCLAFNRISHRWLVNRLFAAVSRLGNGVFWYVLMGVLPLLYGMPGARASLHMALVGLLCLPLYKGLKQVTLRDRPYTRDTAILQNVPPLDRFSFPSGHTMHAVAFTLVLMAYLPAWGWAVAPFTLLVALSRLVLGLHYPSDVLVGAGIGAAVALGSLALAGTGMA
ncbi:MAG: phosphatase PAP2 family protein [Ectothiorhodospira sp.]